MSTDVKNRRKSPRNNTDVRNNRGGRQLAYELASPHNREIVAVATRDNTNGHLLTQSAGIGKGGMTHKNNKEMYTIGT